MEFLDPEKRMIIGALENEWGDLTDILNKLTCMWQSGVRFEGKALQAATQVFRDFQYFLDIEKKIFESIEDEEEKQRLLGETNQTMSQFDKCKEIVGFFKDDKQPETNDSDGVLGDKAQD